MKKENKKDIYAEQRRDWGMVRPVSVAHKDKTKYSRKAKHKGREDWD